MDNVVNFFKANIEQFLRSMIGEHLFEYEDSSTLRFSREMGGDNFVLAVFVCNQYNYVALTNILLPHSMLKKGVTMEIITILVNLCNKVGYNCCVTEIVNNGYREALIRHGGVAHGYEDVVIDKDKWLKKNPFKELKFIVVEDALILESEAEEYRQLRQKCITEVHRIFDSWGADIDITQSRGYIEQIVADKGEDTYCVTINYYYCNYINELINKDELEEYLKKHNGIGSWF